MTSWKLAPCLDVLNKEIAAIAPDADTTSNGTIGDEAHQGTDSDHNPDSNGYVCATDRDKDLNAAFTMEDVVQYLLGECRKANTVGKDYGRLNYMIYNKRIWRADTGWRQEPYYGSSPHTEHAHFSCEHDLQFVNDTRPFGLIDRFGDDMDQVTFNERMDTYLKKYNQDGNGWKSNPTGVAVLDNQYVPNPFNGAGQKSPLYDLIRDLAEAVIELRNTVDNLTPPSQG